MYSIRPRISCVGIRRISAKYPIYNALHTTRVLGNSNDVLGMLTEMTPISPEKIDPAQYFELLRQAQTNGGAPVSIENSSHKAANNKVILPEDLVVLYNQLIKSFAKDDYSIATVASNALRKLPVGAIEIESLAELIRYNPGRVASSWEIFMSEVHSSKSFQSSIKENVLLKGDLLATVIEKLIHGDAADIEDGFEPGLDEFSKVYFLLHYYDKEHVTLPATLQKTLVEKAIDLKCPWILNSVDISPSILRDTLANTNLSDLEFAVVFINLWKHKQEISDYGLLSRLLPPICMLSNEGVKLSGSEEEALLQWQAKISKYDAPLEDSVRDFEDTFSEVLKQMHSIIKHNKLDEGSSVNAVSLRSNLVHSYGVHKNDLAAAERLFQEYSETHSPFIDQLRSVLSVVKTIHACNQNSVDNLVAAEALVKDYSSIPIKNLQALILGYAFLGQPEKSLELFNTHIASTAKIRESALALSAAGKLTESLILGYLYNFDREFAYLINDGAIENKVVEGDAEIAKLKNLFKVYGQAFEDEDDLKAKKILGDYVLQSLKSL